MENNQTRFLLRYEGAVLKNNVMNIDQLAPALVEMSAALTSLNGLLNNRNVKVSLSIKAFKAGCFGIDLQLAQDFLSQIGNVLAGTGVYARCNADTLVHTLLEVIFLKKWLNGRTPDLVIPDKTTRQVTLQVNNTQITVSENVYVAYQNHEFQSHLAKIAEPLRTDGIDSVSVSDTTRIETVNKADLQTFQTFPDDKILSQDTVLRIVMLETAALYKDQAKWRFKMGEGSSFFAVITDEDFLQRIDNGSERFGRGDLLKVELETVQTLSAGKILVSYNIRKVLDHKSSAEQLSLFLSNRS